MEQQTIRTVSRPRNRRRVPTLLAAALAAPLALSCLAVPAHAAEQFLDAAVPFCTPGILSSTGPADSALGFYDIGDGLLTADLVADTDSSNCLKATGAGLLLELDGVQLNLTGNISMPTVPGPLHALQADTINAVLCESYYPGNSLFWLALQNANGDTQGTPALGGVTGLQYSLQNRVVRAQIASAAHGPWLRCHDASSANVALPQDPLFSASFEDRADLQVAFLSESGLPIESLDQTIGEDVTYQVRITNHGDSAAHNVRVREFLPRAGGQLLPTMTALSCTDQNEQPCAGPGNLLHEQVAMIASGQSLTYTLERHVPGGAEIPAAGGALTSVAAFVDPQQGGEHVPADNSRHLRIGLVANAAPTANAQAVNGTEDVPLQIVLTGSDPESDPLSFNIASPPAHGVVELNGATVTYTPAANYAGADSFTFRAHDGTVNSAPATISITLAAVNDAPQVASPLPDLVRAEGAALDISTSGGFSDPEGDALSYTITGLPAGIIYSPSTGVIVGLLGDTTAGDYEVEVTATEVASGGLSASQSFQLQVTNTNQPPFVAAPLVDLANDEGDLVSIDVSSAFADADLDDTLSFALVAGSLPQPLQLEADGSISGTLSQTSAGVYEITVEASDGQGGSVQDSFQWTVAAVNVAPVAASIDDLPQQGQTIEVGGILEILAAHYRDQFSDPDGDVLAFDVDGLPAGLVLFGSGNISGVLAPGTEGDHLVTVTATDPDGLDVQGTFTITVAAAD